MGVGETALLLLGRRGPCMMLPLSLTDDLAVAPHQNRADALGLERDRSELHLVIKPRHRLAKVLLIVRKVLAVSAGLRAGQCGQHPLTKIRLMFLRTTTRVGPTTGLPQHLRTMAKMRRVPNSTYSFVSFTSPLFFSSFFFPLFLDFILLYR